MHWDGNSWTGFTSDRAPLSDVWAVGPNQAWVAGNGLAQLGDGPRVVTTLPSSATGAISAVTGTATDDVWAIAREQAVHFDGRAWSSSISFDHEILAIAARARDDVWLAVDTGNGRSRLAHGDGTEWTTAPAPAPVHALWTAADGTAWMGGDRGALLRRTKTP